MWIGISIQPNLIYTFTKRLNFVFVRHENTGWGICSDSWVGLVQYDLGCSTNATTSRGCNSQNQSQPNPAIRSNAPPCSKLWKYPSEEESKHLATCEITALDNSVLPSFSRLLLNGETPPRKHNRNSKQRQWSEIWSQMSNVKDTTIITQNNDN